jgi:hypothetical protein
MMVALARRGVFIASGGSADAATRNIGRPGSCNAAADGSARQQAVVTADSGRRMVDSRGVPSLSDIRNGAGEPSAARVVLADDDVLLREGLASLLHRSTNRTRARQGTRC